MQHLGSRGDGGHDEFLVQICFCSGLFGGEQCLTRMSLRGAVVSDGGGGSELQTDRQTDPRYRVFPERQLPGRLKQTGVCEGLLGKKKSRELYNLLTDPHFHSGSFCLSSPLAKTQTHYQMVTDVAISEI